MVQFHGRWIITSNLLDFCHNSTGLAGKWQFFFANPDKSVRLKMQLMKSVDRLLVSYLDLNYCECSKATTTSNKCSRCCKKTSKGTVKPAQSMLNTTALVWKWHTVAMLMTLNRSVKFMQAVGQQRWVWCDDRSERTKSRLVNISNMKTTRDQILKTQLQLHYCMISQ